MEILEEETLVLIVKYSHFIEWERFLLREKGTYILASIFLIIFPCILCAWIDGMWYDRVGELMKIFSARCFLRKERDVVNQVRTTFLLLQSITMCFPTLFFPIHANVHSSTLFVKFSTISPYIKSLHGSIHTYISPSLHCTFFAFILAFDDQGLLAMYVYRQNIEGTDNAHNIQHWECGTCGTIAQFTFALH